MPKTTRCSADPPWFISCSSLIPTEDMKIVFITISVLIIVASFLSIVIHVVYRKSNKAFSLNVVSLNLNDIVLAVYFTIIWISDAMYGDYFYLQETKWRSSSTCFSAGFLLLMFTFTAQFMITLLSLSRLMIVANPLDTNFKRVEFILKYILAIVFFALLLPISFVLATKFTISALPLSLCLPFIDPQKSSVVIKVITWIVAISQTATSIVNIVLHVLLVQKLRKSQKIVAMSQSKPGKGNLNIITQLFIVTISNILCWLPANIIYITAMFLDRYSTDLIIWTTVGVMPINSVINPVVFTIVCLRKNWDEMKFNAK